METLSLTEFLSEMEQRGENGTSKYQLRNEQAQFKNRVTRFGFLKKEKKKHAKLLVMLELAIPFNPMTGKPDDKYNADCKFRPNVSPTTLALMLKKNANEIPAVKETFMRYAGVEDWDTSDTTTLNSMDKLIFKKHRVPKIFTFPVVHVNIPALTGDFGKDYMINVEYDNAGNVVGELPLILQADKFFKGCAYEEVTDYEKKIEDKLIDDTEQVQKTKRQTIFAKNPVSDDHPSNWVLMAELPLDTKYYVADSVNLAAISKDEIKEHVVLTKLNKKLREALAKYKDDSWAKYDTYFDFWEIDLEGPTEGNTPAEIGMGTNYSKPQEVLSDCKGAEKFQQACCEYFDSLEDLEQIIINTTRIPQYDGKVERQLLTALEPLVEKTIESDFCTQKVITASKDFITLVMGDKADDILLDIEMDMSDKADGAYDADAAKAVAKENSIDLDEVLMDDLESDDLVE